MLNLNPRLITRNLSLILCKTFYSSSPLKKVFLHHSHINKGAEMIAFCGYSLPLQYRSSQLMQSHTHTRESCSLFDVSHMNTTRIEGTMSHSFVRGLIGQFFKPSKLKYGLLLNENGGILDDVVVLRKKEDEFIMISNAVTEEKVNKHLRDELLKFNTTKKAQVRLCNPKDQCILALQGPLSKEVLKESLGVIPTIKFMESFSFTYKNFEVMVNRCGYTGEDGFEIITPNAIAEEIFEELVTNTKVKLAGLGARDTLRLEAGLCLYGNDMNQETSPFEADLMFAISPKRLKDENFLGACALNKILKQNEIGPNESLRKRVGLIVKDAIARNGTKLFSNEKQIGNVTSGIYSPSLKVPIAMGYVEQKYARTDTQIQAEIRGKRYTCTISKLPFLESKYYK